MSVYLLSCIVQCSQVYCEVVVSPLWFLRWGLTPARDLQWGLTPARDLQWGLTPARGVTTCLPQNLSRLTSSSSDAGTCGKTSLLLWDRGHVVTFAEG